LAVFLFFFFFEEEEEEEEEGDETGELSNATTTPFVMSAAQAASMAAI